MSNAGVELMARPKSTHKGKPTEPNQAPRLTIINLKGSEAHADWLEAVHKKTHIAKSVIVRLALTQWAEQNGHPPFPSTDDGA